MAGGLDSASPFGVQLRRWRMHRGVSQLALATTVGSTARHLSFLETGRSRPSRQMVLRLGEALEMSLRERNRLLHAAGLAAAFAEQDLDSVDVAPYRAAIDRLLRAHLPYPAMVVDRYWTVVMANTACTALYGPNIAGSNIVRRFLAEPAARQAIVNWPDVAWAGLDRLKAHWILVGRHFEIPRRGPTRSGQRRYPTQERQDEHLRLDGTLDVEARNSRAA